MNANEAKKLALDTKKQLEQNLKVKEEKAFNADVQLFHKFLKDKIMEAAKKGLLTISETFPTNRFEVEVVREVNSLLKLEGFTLAMENQNAFQTTKYTVSWV